MNLLRKRQSFLNKKQKAQKILLFLVRLDSKFEQRDKGTSEVQQSISNSSKSTWVSSIWRCWMKELSMSQSVFSKRMQSHSSTCIQEFLKPISISTCLNLKTPPFTRKYPCIIACMYVFLLACLTWKSQFSLIILSSFWFDRLRRIIRVRSPKRIMGELEELSAFESVLQK